jgi:predicted neuraminidase
MKRPNHLTLLTGAWLMVAATAFGASLPETRSIFPLQEKHVHSSSIVECPNGDLLACWFHGSGERSANDVLVQGARLKAGSETWSPVFVMADTPGLPDCNPVLFVDPRKRLWLFWMVVAGNRWEHSILKYRRADSLWGDGAPRWTWQDIIILKPGEDFPNAIARGFEALGADEGCWGEYAPPYEQLVGEAAKDVAKRQRGWMTRIHPLVLPSGRWLLPLYSDGFNLAMVGLSDDEGETWQASAPIVGYGPIQPSLAQRRDGTILAFMRDSGGAPQRIQWSESTDSGQTWTPSRDIDIPNPSSSLEVVVLQDGRWLLVCNDTEDGRHQLTAFISNDEGATWPWRKQIEPADTIGQSFGYPSVVQGRDGRVHLTYSRQTTQGRTIQHTVLPLSWFAGEAPGAER